MGVGGYCHFTDSQLPPRPHQHLPGDWIPAAGSSIEAARHGSSSVEGTEGNATGRGVPGGPDQRYVCVETCSGAQTVTLLTTSPKPFPHDSQGPRPPPRALGGPPAQLAPGLCTPLPAEVSVCPPAPTQRVAFSCCNLRPAPAWPNQRTSLLCRALSHTPFPVPILVGKLPQPEKPGSSSQPTVTLWGQGLSLSVKRPLVDPLWLLSPAGAHNSAHAHDLTGLWVKLAVAGWGPARSGHSGHRELTTVCRFLK